jgi:ubiquitin-protein ligase E3 B
MADSGPGAGVGVWTAPTLTRGVYDVSDVDVPALGLFCLAYAHLLLVLDDEEFFGKQRPFSLGEQRCVSFYLYFRMGN